MGQYHILVNLTKKQFVHPHQVGNGLKLWGQVGWEHSLSTALYMLIAASNDRGGGDFAEHPMVGSWAGDSIALIGDYAEPNDVPSCLDSQLVYKICMMVCYPDKDDNDYIKNLAKSWTHISDKVRDMMMANFPDIRYKKTAGWMEIEKVNPEDMGKKFAEFCYPSSNWGWDTIKRKVQIIEEDDTYIKGLDTIDRNRFKQFRKDRVIGNIVRY